MFVYQWTNCRGHLFFLMNRLNDIGAHALARRQALWIHLYYLRSLRNSFPDNYNINPAWVYFKYIKQQFIILTIKYVKTHSNKYIVYKSFKFSVCLCKVTI